MGQSYCNLLCPCAVSPLLTTWLQNRQLYCRQANFKVTLKCLLTSSCAFGWRQQAWIVFICVWSEDFARVYTEQELMGHVIGCRVTAKKRWKALKSSISASASQHYKMIIFSPMLHRQWCKHSVTRSEMTPYALLRAHRRHPWASIILGTICTSPLTERGKGAFSALYLVMISHNPLNEEAKKGKKYLESKMSKRK